MYQGPGIYRHYKGGQYEVLGLGKSAHKHGEDLVVVYRRHFVGEVAFSLYPGNVEFWLRDVSHFNERIELPMQGVVERFVKVGELP